MPTVCNKFDMSVCRKITNCGNFICKAYYFLSAVILYLKVEFQFKRLIMQFKLKRNIARVPYKFRLD